MTKLACETALWPDTRHLNERSVHIPEVKVTFVVATGKIIERKRTGVIRTRAMWNQMGFSFTGNLKGIVRKG